MKKNFGKPQMEPPVKVGDELELSIDSVGSKGDGVSRFNNYVIFVPGAQKGEKLRAKVTRTMSRFGFAEKIQ